jgi:hypothetical protein
VVKSGRMDVHMMDLAKRTHAMNSKGVRVGDDLPSRDDAKQGARVG